MQSVVIHVGEGSTLARAGKRECEEHEKNRGPGRALSLARRVKNHKSGGGDPSCEEFATGVCLRMRVPEWVICVEIADNNV